MARNVSHNLLAGSISLLVFVGACQRADETPPPAATPATPAAAAAPPPAAAGPKYRAEFETSKGKFVVEVTPELSPLGAERFRTLIDSGYFKDVAVFRVLPGFIVQFGMHGDPAVNERWQKRPLTDETVRVRNTRGTIVYAKGGPNSRSNQYFINLGDNSASLDPQGFSPFGQVVEGMDVIEQFFSGYAEEPSNNQPLIGTDGNKYLKKAYPKLDYIKSARIVQ